MANKIVYHYPQMEAAANNIKGFAEEYRQAAATFKSAIEKATANWEGASKDKFSNLINNSVNKYMSVTVPELVNALGEMLAKNAEGMKNADSEIAKNIPDSL